MVRVMAGSLDTEPIGGSLSLTESLTYSRMGTVNHMVGKVVLDKQGAFIRIVCPTSTIQNPR